MQHHQSTRNTIMQARLRACLLLIFSLSIFISGTTTQAQSKSSDDLLTPPRRLLPEGTFVVARQATIIPAGSTGAWIVNFTNEPGDTKLPPMYLMPSRRLARLETSLARQSSDKLFLLIISGRVFVYRNYQFLMLTAVPRLVAAASQTNENKKSETPPADDSTIHNDETQSNKAKTPPSPPSASADVEAMIHELEVGGPVAPIIRAVETKPVKSNDKTTTMPDQSTESKSESEPLREGVFINNRSVRMVRSPNNGAWSVVFDSDASGLQDPPLIILPCQLLQQMEHRAEQSGDRFRVKISGVIYLYHEGKYILPTSMVIPYKQENLSP